MDQVGFFDLQVTEVLTNLNKKKMYYLTRKPKGG